MPLDPHPSQIDAHALHLRFFMSHSTARSPCFAPDLVKSRTLVVVTWGDSDMCVISRQCRRQQLQSPAGDWLRNWINLKEAYLRHYRREARGGLQAVVDSLPGLRFEGRAHSGLVDAQNTAAVAARLVAEGYRFLRPTRGLGPDGEPWGGKRAAEQGPGGGGTAHS